MHRKEIDILVDELSNNVLGLPQYLHKYNVARSQVEGKLTNDQHQQYKAMAKK